MKLRDISNFTDNEYKQWAQNKNFSAFANVMSGLNFASNKIMYTLYSENITSFQKVEIIANATALKTEYPGGANNLEGVVYSNIKDYVTGTNLPIIDRKGDTGKRLNKTPAAARYNFAKLHSNFAKLINKDDLSVVGQYFYEGKNIEYKFMPFHLPMILINGNEGIGSGYAQKILPRDPLSIKKYLELKLKNSNKLSDDLLYPHFKGFLGNITKGTNQNQWNIFGKVERISKTQTNIVEVHNGHSYKTIISTLDGLIDKNKIKSYVDLCDPIKDMFFIKVKHEDYSHLTDEELMNILKITTTVTENFTAIDEFNRVIVFQDAKGLFDYYYDVKLRYMQLRKDYIISNIEKDMKVNVSKYLFVKAIIDGNLAVNNKKKDDIVTQIETLDRVIKVDESYDYLLRMPLYSLTKDKMDELKATIQKLKEELTLTKEISIEQMWLSDLEGLEKVLKK
jgi:DNA topoisomerase-2